MVSYKVEIRKSALKELHRLDRHVVPHLFRKIESLAGNPRPPQSLKLRCSANSYRLRVGDYCIIYQIDDAKKQACLPASGG